MPVITAGLLLSFFFLFYGLTVGKFPDIWRIRMLVMEYLIPGVSAVVFFIIFSVLCMTPIAGIFWAILGWHTPGYISSLVMEKKRLKLQETAKNFITSSAGLFAAGQSPAEVIRNISMNIKEPFRTEFQKILAVWNLDSNVSIPNRIAEMGERFKLPELTAAAAILAAAEATEGPRMAAKGLKKLGTALRQRDRLRAERKKAVMEPKIAAFVVISLLISGLLLDVTVLRELFMSTKGKLILAAASALDVGLVFMAVKIMRGADLA